MSSEEKRDKKEPFKSITIKSVVWSAVERFSVQAIQFVITIVLARLIAPTEFGLIAMLGIFLQIAQSFVDSGFSNALIQKQGRTEEDFSTVFYFNCLISVAVYIILYFLAPYIATFYNEPLLTPVCRWIGLNVIIQGVAVVQLSKITIALNFKSQAKASLVSVIISGCFGLVFAFLGYGVWALVVQSLCNSLLNTIILFILVKWIPKDRFSWNSLKNMFRFGSKLLLSGLLHTLYTNLYSLVIGKRYNALEVGYYNQSNQIARFPSVSLMAVITRALYPIQCRNQDNQDLLGASFLRYIKFSSLIVFSIMIMIASLSVPLVNILLTNKWNSISSLISILCVGYMFTPITVLNNQILNVKGRSDLFLKVEILKKIAGIIILIASIPFGLDIICLGILAYNIIDMLLVMCFARKIHNISPLNQIISVLPIFIATVGSGIMCFLITCLISSYVIQLLLGLIVFISTLLILSKILRISEISFVINMIRTILQSQK